MAESASRLGRLLSHNLAVLTDRPGPGAVICAVMLALLVLRAVLFPGTGGDDGEQLIFSQFFQWGYQVRNPPLYTWLVMAVAEVTGPGLWAVNIVKFALLTAMYLFLWRASLRLFATPVMAGLAALSPVLMYFVAWEVVTGFSHTVLTACLYAAVLWLLLRLRDGGQGRVGDYALLGLVIGLGAMSKYVFWLFLISLIAAAMTDRDLRRRLILPRIAVTLAVAAAVMAPHYHWLLPRLGILEGQAGDVAGEGAAFSLRGLGHAAKAAAGFLSPYWLIMLACFPAAFKRLPVGSPLHPMARVIGLQIALVLIMTVIGTLTLPEFRIRTHYMFVLLFAPLWMLLRAEAAGAAPGRQGAYGLALSAALIAAPLGLAGKFLFEPLFCGRCQHHIPYDALAKGIRDLGFTGGTIVAHWHPDPLPGNLRIRFPDARVISTKHGDVIPPLKDGANDQCLVVWSADAPRDGRPPAVGGANQLLSAGIPKDAPTRLIAAPLAGPSLLTGGKTAVLGVVLTPGNGSCR
ncbi:MAG TPA: hypothetical protein DCG48_14150 [Rhodospirillaceae bacterium]|nr:hypothetical protein [Rhodospirillaceae bacterium]|tara:strand:+ start:494 stop:2047 length:1554 start_codon:yes stop_codon:yes gene_type:complete